jgi:hypothetical protein
MITTQGLQLTSHGHCYQYLIYQSLENSNVKKSDIDTYMNILSELGIAILNSPTESLDSLALDAFFQEYSHNFLAVNKEKVINDLINSFILQESETGIRFRYRYLFYFFAAKKLSDSLHRGDSAKKKIRDLVNLIHMEKACNIIIFLTHHSKDPWILDEIMVSVMDVFPEEKKVVLDTKSLSFLNDFVREIPEMVLENRDARQARLQEDKDKDVVDRCNGQSNSLHEEADDIDEFMIKVNKVFRSIEVCGQILRNRFGSLERDSLELIYEESLSISLRFLGMFLRYSELLKEEATRNINSILEQFPNTPDATIIKKVENSYLSLNYLFIFGMLHKIAFSLGSSRGHDIYIKVTDKDKTPASQLIQEIIELQFDKKIDMDKIERLHKEFTKSKNVVCNRLLRQIVLRHCYFHDVRFKERQKLAEKLSIPINVQRSIMIPPKSNH